MTAVNLIDGKYCVQSNGKTVRRASLYQMNYFLRTQGMTDAVVGSVGGPNVNVSIPVAKSEFSPSERMGFIEDFVNMLVRGKINSFICTGSGGMGKTTKITNVLIAAGLSEDMPKTREDSDDDYSDNMTGDFLVIKGFSTPRALYDTLYNTNGKILVLDDADQVFKDPLGANLLKSALDDKKERVITWATSRESGDGIPNRFTYTGRIVFISNLSIDKFPQALISRSQKVDLTLTNVEKVELISDIFADINFDNAMKKDVLSFVKKYADESKDLNIRSAVALLTLREEFGSKWERIAKYSFCAV